MAANKTCNGFRICCELQISVTSKPVKAFVFIRIVEWAFVKDVKRHIMKIFNLKDDIDLFIEDCLLPENESIKLINSTDVLIVKNSSTKQEDVSVNYGTFAIEMNGISSAVEDKEVTTSGVDESLLDACMDELSKKRQQLLKTEVKSSGENLENLTADEGIPVKRKRKRKHKKRNISIDNIVNSNEGDMEKNVFQIYKKEQRCKNMMPETKVFNGCKSMHKRFSDEDESKTTVEQTEEEETDEVEMETIVEPERRGEDTENPELVGNSFVGESNDANDLKSKLLSLASDRKSGKIFSRLNRSFC